jgi:hypothetical protein
MTLDHVLGTLQEDIQKIRDNNKQVIEKLVRGHVIDSRALTLDYLVRDLQTILDSLQQRDINLGYFEPKVELKLECTKKTNTQI